MHHAVEAETFAIKVFSALVAWFLY